MANLRRDGGNLRPVKPIGKGPGVYRTTDFGYVTAMRVAGTAAGTPVGAMHHEAGARQRLFMAWVMMSLATALFCALLPAGLPAGSNLGSAFNPSNTIVSLNAPSMGRALSKRIIEEDDDTSAAASISRPVALVPAVDSAPDGRIAEPVPATALADAGLPAAASTGMFRARAPPRV